VTFDEFFYIKIAVCSNAVDDEITGVFSCVENHKNYARSYRVNQSRISF